MLSRTFRRLQFHYISTSSAHWPVTPLSFLPNDYTGDLQVARSSRKTRTDARGDVVASASAAFVHCSFNACLWRSSTLFIQSSIPSLHPFSASNVAEPEGVRCNYHGKLSPRVPVGEFGAMPFSTPHQFYGLWSKVKNIEADEVKIWTSTINFLLYYLCYTI